MSPVRARPLFLVVVLTLAAMARPAFAVNPRAEAAALDALSKAEGDFLGMNYASGAARLDKALRACAPANCSANTQAALLRDIGTMEFRAGDRGFATKAFTEALKLQPNIDINPSYDAPDLRALWNEVKGGGGGGGPPVGGGGVPAGPSATGVAPPQTFAQPRGDFIHTPAAEQVADTPLPIYVEGGPNGVAHVIVRFKSSEDSEEAEWQHMDLSRVGAGWGGQLPCAAVLGGTVRYYIQGYNKDMDPIATNGDAKNPYQVPIRDELAGPAPHLPNRAPPRICHPPKKVAAARERERDRDRDRDNEDTGDKDTGETAKDDCPPGMPGCGKEKEKTDEDEDKGDEEEGGEGKKKKKIKAPRIWVGIGLNIDFMQIPSGTDVCRLHPGTLFNQMPNPQAGLPANDKHFYCTDPNGADVPTRGDHGLQNDQLTPTNAGQSAGGVSPANVRIMAALDYAVSNNILIGARLGWVFLTYPGAAAVQNSYAWGQKYYVEGRITGFIGKDPLKKGTLAPMVFGGGGVSSTDAHTSGTVRLCAAQTSITTLSCAPPLGNLAAPKDIPVDEWITNGPGFADLGLGLRYAATREIGLLGAVRVNLSFGNNGLIPTVGPEIGLQYGF